MEEFGVNPNKCAVLHRFTARSKVKVCDELLVDMDFRYCWEFWTTAASTAIISVAMPRPKGLSGKAKVH